MLNYLRRVHFPSNLQTSGPIVSARLLGHVKDHSEIIDNAKLEASNILEEAEQTARSIREQVRERMAASIKNDLNLLKSLTARKEEHLLNRSADICVEACLAVFNQIMGSQPEQSKIRIAAINLLKTHHHSQTLNIFCHPDQLEQVRNEIAQVMAEQMNLKTWAVTPNERLALYELMISTPNGAEIRVSLDNILTLYREEIEALGQQLAPIMVNHEDTNETVS